MYKGRENYETVKHLMAGEECIVTGYGQSMTPILKSGQSVRCIPVAEETVLKKNDIVLCKVAGHFYLRPAFITANSTVQAAVFRECRV